MILSLGPKGKACRERRLPGLLSQPVQSIGELRFSDRPKVLSQ